LPSPASSSLADIATSWLQPEYDGPRSPSEAIGDLRTIAAGGPLSEAHVVMATPRDDPTGRRGNLSLDERRNGASVVVAVDGEIVAQINPTDVHSSHLRTYDDADYYVLVIETADGTLTVSDAYND
jgi:hypothetical protein